MRGRGRKGPNPLSRTYESNGPDVKIRGTAQHVAEKYQQLARDAQASGDRIMSENYFQHAEHYLRIVAAAQANVQPVAQTARGEGDESGQDAAAPAQNERRQRPERSDRSERPDRPDRSERPERRERAEARAPQQDAYVEEDSPQPFIEDLPAIDAASQVNGRDAKPEEAPAGGEEDDAKPRRRIRGTRGRGVKRTSEEAEGEVSPEAAEVVAPVVVAEAEEEAPKPKPRRAPRTRRPKVTEEKAEAEPVSAGE
jgi:hypothetical protein